MNNIHFVKSTCVLQSMNLLANALRGHMARREHLRRVQNEQKDEQQTRETDAPRAERRPSSRSSAPAPPKRGTPAADADTTQRQQRVDSPAYDEAVALLQSALQGHSKRQNFLQQQRRGSHARTWTLSTAECGLRSSHSHYDFTSIAILLRALLVVIVSIRERLSLENLFSTL